ncbi:uncharacterized protein LOC110924341 [Helianthus annuus]|uniref:uncharacterized protein LOC110924341 n=1 Tax=Helianthus annuus TaxID=4232 RepID=UPI000B8F270E|nr:uncharacterized protein LOC110924341 [Helianthus annuus]
MRQRCWVELLNDYECDIRYHPVKANVVADALSRKELEKPLHLRALGLTMQTSLTGQIYNVEQEALKDENLRREGLRGLECELIPKADEVMYFMNRVWVPLRGNLRELVMNEAHKSRYSIHPGSTKMYQDIKELYCSPSMKRDIAVYVGDQVMLKVSPWKGVVWFGKGGKLSPRYIGPFEIASRVGSVAYRLKLPQELSGVHDVFHLSNLKKCLSDETLLIPPGEVRVDDKLRFIEEPVEVLDWKIQKLRRSRIKLVKVRWDSKRGPKFTWERQDQMQRKYPHLFPPSAKKKPVE